MAVNKNFLKGVLIASAAGLVILMSMVGGALADRLFVIKPLDAIAKRTSSSVMGVTDQKIVNEESVVTDVAENVSPSVVTVSVQTPQRRVLEFNPFGGGLRSRLEGGDQEDIGSGFIVEGGLVVTNKHVVDSDSEFKVVTQDGKEHNVIEKNIDPANDLAILKIEGGSDYKGLELGDSGVLKVGQFVIAIGTALGEFRHTVTTGVVSGLGRGIVAGSSFEGFAERLDNVIQTDAAINPGNSGGPLLNSSGQVIGVNVAVAAGAENIGFALPINIVKDGLKEFNSTGSFAQKPFLGVEHQMITREGAIFGEVPQGAYVSRVVGGSAAESAGIKAGDIITKIDNQNVRDATGGLAAIINTKKAGDTVTLTIYRGDNNTVTLKATLTESQQ